MKNEDDKLFNQIEFLKVEDNTKVLRYADKMLLGIPLCLDFRDCPVDQASEVLHFLSGINYAINGNIVRLKSNVFLFALKDYLKDESIKNFIKEYKE